MTTEASLRELVRSRFSEHNYEVRTINGIITRAEIAILKNGVPSIQIYTTGDRKRIGHMLEIEDPAYHDLGNSFISKNPVELTILDKKSQNPWIYHLLLGYKIDDSKPIVVAEKNLDYLATTLP